MKKIRTKLLALLALGILSVSAIPTHAAKTEVTVPVPEAVHYQPLYEVPDASQVKERTVTLPALKDGNYEKWIDRIQLPQYALDVYELLEEGADYDGTDDFLIDPDSSDLVEEVSFAVGYDQSNQPIMMSGKGVKVATIYGQGADVNEAAAEIEESYYQTASEMYSVYTAFDRDCSEVFWLTGELYIVLPSYDRWNESTEKVGLKGDVYFVVETESSSLINQNYQNVTTLKTAIEKRDTQIASILKGAEGKSDYEKVRYFNQWLTTHNEYNHLIGYGTQDVNSVLANYPDAFECVSALEGRTGERGPVCEAYARAMKALCDASNIPCVLIDGPAYSEIGGTPESHMWNSICINGKWYGTDVTWNDPLMPSDAYEYHGAVSSAENENYFLVGADTVCGDTGMKFAQSHITNNQMYLDNLGFTNEPVMEKNACEGTTHIYGDPVYTWSEDFKTCMAEKKCTETGCSEKITETVTTVSEITKNSTCQKEGKKTYTAKFTNPYFTEQTKTEAISKAEHSYTKISYEWSQDKTTCTGTAACAGEGCTEKVTETVTAKYTEVVPKTCTTDGLGSMSAAFTKSYFKTQTNLIQLEATGHQWGEWKVTKEAKEGVAGEEERQCSECKEVETRSTDPLPVSITFTDVTDEKSFYYTPVYWAASNGVTTGKPDGSFDPKGDVTRGEMVTFLWRLAGQPETNGAVNKFTDVKSGKYYEKAVLWASNNGIVNGTSETTFEPNAPVTRGQVVAFLYRFAGSQEVTAKNTFTDVYEGKYYYKAVLWAVENNVTSGVSQKLFAPNDVCNRGQAVTFIYRTNAVIQN